MASKLAPLPQASFPWVGPDGKPTQGFYLFMAAQAANNVGPFVSAANDAAAQKAGVPLNGLYENGGVVRIRKA